MDIINNRYNKSTVFLLPLIYPTVTYKGVLFDGFINCYYADVDNDDIVNSVIIEYDTNIVHFRVPDEFIDDYKLIIAGKYSKISNRAKRAILHFWELDNKSYLYSLLHRTDKILKYLENKTKTVLTITDDTEYWGNFEESKELRGFQQLFKTRKY